MDNVEALTDNGVQLTTTITIEVEGNAKPDLDIHQRAERGPAGESRIAHLLAWNVNNRA